MKIGSYRSLVGILAIATAPIIAFSGYGYASPSVLNAIPAGATFPAAATVPFEAGPRETLAQCMAYWDAGTHMSQTEWRRACVRTKDGTIF